MPLTPAQKQKNFRVRCELARNADAIKSHRKIARFLALVSEAQTLALSIQRDLNLTDEMRISFANIYR